MAANRTSAQYDVESLFDCVGIARVYRALAHDMVQYDVDEAVDIYGRATVADAAAYVCHERANDAIVVSERDRWNLYSYQFSTLGV